mmetsp:Transcript_14507/g.36283  ORF Transcript_14507/g.36283 Transcript_14507/m.36283 type:complete len:316 (+) Transcript_14507:1787-2734(+)
MVVVAKGPIFSTTCPEEFRMRNSIRCWSAVVVSSGDETSGRSSTVLKSKTTARLSPRPDCKIVVARGSIPLPFVSRNSIFVAVRVSLFASSSHSVAACPVTTLACAKSNIGVLSTGSELKKPSSSRTISIDAYRSGISISSRSSAKLVSNALPGRAIFDRATCVATGVRFFAAMVVVSGSAWENRGPSASSRSSSPSKASAPPTGIAFTTRRNLAWPRMTPCLESKPVIFVTRRPIWFSPTTEGAALLGAEEPEAALVLFVVVAAPLRATGAATVVPVAAAAPVVVAPPNCGWDWTTSDRLRALPSGLPLSTLTT